MELNRRRSDVVDRLRGFDRDGAHHRGARSIRASAHRIETDRRHVLRRCPACRLDDVNDTLRSTVRFELIIGAIGVFVALVTTYAGVRFSLRGLRRVTTTAQEVAAELSPSGAGAATAGAGDRGGHRGRRSSTESMNTLLAAAETQFAARVESEQRMRQFLADASHELRTPLTSIRGYAELARMQRAATGRRAATRTTSTASSPRAPGCRGWSRTCCCSPAATRTGATSRERDPIDARRRCSTTRSAASRAAFPRPADRDRDRSSRRGRRRRSATSCCGSSAT